MPFTSFFKFVEVVFAALMVVGTFLDAQFASCDSARIIGMRSDSKPYRYTEKEYIQRVTESLYAANANHPRRNKCVARREICKDFVTENCSQVYGPCLELLCTLTDLEPEAWPLEKNVGRALVVLGWWLSTAITRPLTSGAHSNGNGFVVKTNFG